ncbi:MAG: alpha-L-fucosidase [Chloroflexi bacterium]|nr:alpha-L-fucosidase [Chloroflexota bacterium]
MRTNTHNREALAGLFAGALVFSGLPLHAQWSVRVDEGKSPKDMFAVDDPRRNLPDYLFQPFTARDWDASNFAPPVDVARFHDLRYGMFVHFGLSTYRGKELSWGTVQSIKWPDKRHDGYSAPPGPIKDEYLRWPAQMRLEKFNAEEWVRIAEESGFRYMVVAAKHHEGFHMWDTAYSDFKITRTPIGRDYLKEIAEACHKAEMPFGIYYAQREWYHPDYDPKNPKGERHRRYLEYNRNVCRELCTKYGKVDIFWFDALWWGGMFTADMWESESLTRMMRQLQPHMLINNRASLPGDFDTPEQRSGFYQERPWEACLSLTESWSWTGTPPKTREELVRILASTACANGNTLLSWGPQWDGGFDEKEWTRLREVGDWLKIHGESIYGTRGGPWLAASWGGSTRKDKTVYLHVLDRKVDQLTLPGIHAQVISAKLLNGGAAVTFEQNTQSVRFSIPLTARDPADTVVVLTLDHLVTEIVRTSVDASIFNDTIAYGGVILAKNNVGLSAGGITLDLEKLRKVTGVAIERQGEGTPLKLSISEDGSTWTPIGSVERGPTLQEIAVESDAAGASLRGRMARFVKIEASAAGSSALLRRACVYGF